MSAARKQTQIDSPVEVVWGLVADVNRHPDWWPGTIEVECEGIEEGCTYRRVLKTPMGYEDTTISIDTLDECKALKIRCLDTGSFVSFALAESRGGTFVDMEAGMEPLSTGRKVIDKLAGKRYFRRWVDESLDALRSAAGKRRTSSSVSDA